MSSHFLNKNRIFNLLENYVKKNNIEYNIVISLNIEIYFNEKLIFDNIQDNTIYIPYGIDWYGLNDKFAYGNLSAMKKYMNIYLNNRNLIKNNCCNSSNPDCLILINIDFYNLNIIRFKLDYIIDK
jgi:DNA/RNA endonuclease G (NUC1)